MTPWPPMPTTDNIGGIARHLGLDRDTGAYARWRLAHRAGRRAYSRCTPTTRSHGQIHLGSASLPGAPGNVDGRTTDVEKVAAAGALVSMTSKGFSLW